MAEAVVGKSVEVGPFRNDESHELDLRMIVDSLQTLRVVHGLFSVQW